MEQPVTFVNRDGCRLFGMLYVPQPAPARRIGLIISVNAVKYRVGTFRLHTLLARKICALGYYVLSFDPAGIGDSEGEFEFKLLSEHYYDIQTGKYTNDLADACNDFTGRYALDSLLLCGLCGGAISVLMAAASGARIDGVILLNLPVLLEDRKREGEVDHAAKITSAELATHLLAGKLGRLAEANFWRRLLTLQVDLAEEGRLVRRAIAVMVRKAWKRACAPFIGAAQKLDLTTPVSDHRLFNLYFQRAFFQTMAARTRLLFIFAELDPWTGIFKSEFQTRVLQRGNPYEAYCTVEAIAAANHIFSGRQSQRELEQRIVGWLSRWYPTHGT